MRALHPDVARRRIAPDEAQLQIILGSLLGDARIEGPAGNRRMRVVHRVDRERYVWWKYERLVSFAEDAPRTEDGRIGFRTIAHPLFDDLAPLFVTSARGRHQHHVVRKLLAPLGLAVWMTDVGRLELRAELFLPAQRALALTA